MLSCEVKDIRGVRQERTGENVSTRPYGLCILGNAALCIILRVLQHLQNWVNTADDKPDWNAHSPYPEFKQLLIGIGSEWDIEDSMATDHSSGVRMHALVFFSWSVL